MELGSLPIWAQQIGAILLTMVTALTLTWNERRKKDEPAKLPGGETQIVAAAFIDRQALSDLTAAVRNLDGTVRAACEITEKLHEDLREEAMIRAAAARIREQRQ